MSKEVVLSYRRKEFFLKFFSEEAKQAFLTKVRKINLPGGFVKVMFTEKSVPGKSERYFEVSKVSQDTSNLECMERKCQLIAAPIQNNENEFWEELIISCQEIDGAYFAWKCSECINAKAPGEICDTVTAATA